MIEHLAQRFERHDVAAETVRVADLGNEDGAHHVSAECYQWLADVGFTPETQGPPALATLHPVRTIAVSPITAATAAMRRRARPSVTGLVIRRTS